MTPISTSTIIGTTIESFQNNLVFVRPHKKQFCFLPLPFLDPLPTVSLAQLPKETVPNTRFGIVARLNQCGRSSMNTFDGVISKGQNRADCGPQELAHFLMNYPISSITYLQVSLKCKGGVVLRIVQAHT